MRDAGSPVLLAVLLCVAPARAVIVQDEKDARVDSQGFLTGVSITMHRATASVLENTGPFWPIDAPLQVRAGDRAALAMQPMLFPGWFDGGGLIADGVTPLLIRIASTGPLPAQGKTFDLVLTMQQGRFSEAQSLLKVASGTSWVRKSQVTLTPAEPQAFLTFGPVLPGQLPATPTTVIARLEVRSRLWQQGSLEFGICRPPVALVHGYNVKDPTWVGWFTDRLSASRPTSLVIDVGYGIEDQSNTTASLWPLAGTLDEALRTQVEDELHQRWAFTRYDVVGHSQGGVLLRMLCSRNAMNGGGTVEDAGFPPFRNPTNHHRGRFRRVITIGSPHTGSTMCELGTQLRGQGVPVRFRYDSPFIEPVEGHVRPESWLGKLLDSLFQPKFQIGNGSALHTINATLQCDSWARLHLVRTAIYGGAVPGLDTQFPEDYRDSQFLFYSGLYLDEDQPSVANPNTGQTLAPGQIVAPLASDGVVDTNSQVAGGGSNRHSVVVGDISHAMLGDSQTATRAVAEHVLALLDGASSQFGPVTIPASLASFMEDRRTWIAALAVAIKNANRVETSAFYTSAAASAPPPPAGGTSASSGGTTLHFTLQPPAGETPTGRVEWNAAIYGPEDAEEPLLVLATSGAFGGQLTLTIPTGVQGQVVLSVRFPSSSGQTVIGTGQVVFEELSGRTLTGIWLGDVQGHPGEEHALSLRGLYDDGSTMPLFSSPGNLTFSPANPAIATVDGNGRVTMVAVGTTTVTGTYHGTLTDVVAVTVRDAAPTVVSPATITGTVGQPLSRQLAASQAVDSYAVEVLPPGVTLNTQSGLIGGAPTGEGRTVATLTVENGNGRGSKVMEFVIAGAPGGPTDVGLDGTSVRNGQLAGWTVGRFTTGDPNPLDTFTYQLVGGAGTTDNALFAIAGDELVTAAVLNRTPGAPLTIRVRTMDATGAAFEKPIGLTVGMPPAITRQPQPQRVFTGETVNFSVEVQSAAPESYQWYRNGVPLTGANARILTLWWLMPDEAGSYSVAVSNPDGSVTSAAATLSVDPISYDYWASGMYWQQSGSHVQPGGDYNGDGVANFLEYAFGAAWWWEPGVTALPFVSKQGTDFFLTYRAAIGITPLSYRILQSTNMTAWSAYQPSPGDVSSENTGGSFNLFKVRVPPPSSQRFFKLEVSAP